MNSICPMNFFRTTDATDTTDTTIWKPGLKAGFHIVVSGRFGSFRVVSNGWDDPERPRRLYGNYTETTANDHERPRTTDDPGRLR